MVFLELEQATCRNHKPFNSAVRTMTEGRHHQTNAERLLGTKWTTTAARHCWQRLKILFWMPGTRNCNKTMYWISAARISKISIGDRHNAAVGQGPDCLSNRQRSPIAGGPLSDKDPIAGATASDCQSLAVATNISTMTGWSRLIVERPPVIPKIICLKKSPSVRIHLLVCCKYLSPLSCWIISTWDTALCHLCPEKAIKLRIRLLYILWSCQCERINSTLVVLCGDIEEVALCRVTADTRDSVSLKEAIFFLKQNMVLPSW